MIYQDFQLSKLHRNKLMQEAEHMRLAKSLQTHPLTLSRFARIYRSSLNRLGQELVALGSHLQRRYGTLTLATDPESDSDCQSGLAC